MKEVFITLEDVPEWGSHLTITILSIVPGQFETKVESDCGSIALSSAEANRLRDRVWGDKS